MLPVCVHPGGVTRNEPMRESRPEEVARIEEEEWANAARDWEERQRASRGRPRPPFLLMRSLRWALQLVGGILIGAACGLLALLGVIFALRALS